jgi:hypothetical protein
MTSSSGIGWGYHDMICDDYYGAFPEDEWSPNQGVHRSCLGAGVIWQFPGPIALLAVRSASYSCPANAVTPAAL